MENKKEYRPYRIEKTKRVMICNKCDVLLEKGQHYFPAFMFCLNCVEKTLTHYIKIDRKTILDAKKSILSEKKALRTIKRYPKERIVQKLS